MDLSGYLTALRKSWWVIVVLALLGGAYGAYSGYTTKPVYAAHVTFYVQTPVTSAASASSAGQYAQDRATTYALLLSSDTLAARVSTQPGVNLPASSVAGKISASATLNTVIVNATVKDTSKSRALVIAHGISTAFPAMVSDLDNTGTRSVTLSVISGPKVGNTPVAPRKTLEVLVGLLVGLALGLVAAVLRDLLDTSLRNVEDLEDISGIPVLATIAYDGDAKAAPLMLDNSPNSVRSEDFRHLRSSLQFIGLDQRMDVVVVTSAVAQEGKSTTSINLGLVCAKQDRRVLLIEADLRRSTIGTYLGLESAVGLSDVLIGEVAIEDVIQPFADTSLSVLLSGQLPPNPSELLGGSTMATLVDTLRDKYDLIIIDTPPIVPVSDAGVLAASIPDAGIILVVKAKTRRALVVSALRALSSVDARVVGTVLNMKHRRRSERSTYGYYASRNA